MRQYLSGTKWMGLVGNGHVVEAVVVGTCNRHGEYPMFKVRGSQEAVGECQHCRAEREHDSIVESILKAQLYEVVGILGDPWRIRHEECRTTNYKHEPADLLSLGYSPAEVLMVQRAFQTIIQFRDGFRRYHGEGKWMFWCGLPGTGKDHLAVGLYRDLILRRYKVHLMSVDDLLGRMWAIVRGESKVTEEQILKVIGSLDLLILNELGLRVYNERELAFLQRVVSRVYDEVACLVFIGNLPFDHDDHSVVTVKNLLGDRIMSRAEECGYWMVPFTWRDFRPLAGLVEKGISQPTLFEQ